MSEQMNNRDRLLRQADLPAYYEIKLEGHLQAHWSEWLGELEITTDPLGQTDLAGWVADQSALFGILATIRDLGLALVSVNRIGRRVTEVRGTLPGGE